MRRLVRVAVAASAAAALALVVGHGSAHTPYVWSPTPDGNFRPITRPEGVQALSTPTVESSPSPTPSVNPTSTPTGRPERKDRSPAPRPRPDATGTASTYGSGYDGLFAVPHRSWRGHRVRICYHGRCTDRTVNDYGPAKRLNRVADLDTRTFEWLCRCNWRTVGVLRGVTLYLID